MYHIRNRVEELKRNPNAAKLLVLRVLCCVVFVAAAACTTALTYDRSKYAQYDRFISRFDSVSERALDAVVNRFRRMNSGIQELSSTYSHVFPNATSWPNVAWQGFIPTATLLSKFSAIQGLAILPLVQPAQGARFSEFLVDYYKTDPYFDRELTFREEFPNATIWYADFSVVPTARYPDHYGNTTASPHQILTPAAQYTFSALAGPHLLAYNVHSNPLYTEAIDNVINCVASHNYSFALESCGAISKFNNIADETDMMGIYIHPIFPAGNQSVLAGFATGTISWKALLTNVIPKDVSGIDCVIESDAGAFTFRIEAGLPHLIGQGDLHEDRFSRYQARSKLINARVAISDSISYTLSFYPTQELEKSFVNEEPLYAALFMLGTFLFCSALFAFYDRLTIREFDRNLAVLDTKRRFVRFISHEIRTPLNTVRLGMKLLEVEMAKFAIAVASSSPGNMISKVNAVLTVWKQLADEIIESSESAVEVLNDLLNYDKIEVGTLKLEFSTWDIRSLGERTVAAMQVQARQKDITLMWACTWAGVQDESERGVPALDCSLLRDDCTVIGDSLRMAQVLRNLISNALKFTPSGGNVSVTGEIKITLLLHF
jgi:signal transduction histidine kinase